MRPQARQHGAHDRAARTHFSSVVIDQAPPKDTTVCGGTRAQVSATSRGPQRRCVVASDWSATATRHGGWIERCAVTVPAPPRPGPGARHVHPEHSVSHREDDVHGVGAHQREHEQRTRLHF
jgi:hypothetical protein